MLHFKNLIVVENTLVINTLNMIKVKSRLAHFFLKKAKIVALLGYETQELHARKNSDHTLCGHVVSSLRGRYALSLECEVCSAFSWSFRFFLG